MENDSSLWRFRKYLLIGWKVKLNPLQKCKILFFIISIDIATLNQVSPQILLCVYQTWYVVQSKKEKITHNSCRSSQMLWYVISQKIIVSNNSNTKADIITVCNLFIELCAVISSPSISVLGQYGHRPEYWLWSR